MRNDDVFGMLIVGSIIVGFNFGFWIGVATFLLVGAICNSRN